jgi:DNA-binding CsgD family transcriptional regulator
MGADELGARVAWFTEVADVFKRLSLCKSVGELFARAAEVAIASGFDRACVLAVEGDELTAEGGDALADPASDRLRRRALSPPVPIRPGTLEAEVVRHGAAGRRAARASVLADALELQHFELGAIAPEPRPVALLVVDRATPLDDLDRAVVASLAAVTGLGLERIVLRARVSEVSSELKQLVGATQALMTETLSAPLAVPTPIRSGYAFPLADPTGTAGTAELLTEREEQIARLLVEGRSNREIAERLVLSPETVKDYVARLRRKLHAANRVEAAARYLRLVQAG